MVALNLPFETNGDSSRKTFTGKQKPEIPCTVQYITNGRKVLQDGLDSSGFYPETETLQPTLHCRV